MEYIKNKIIKKICKMKILSNFIIKNAKESYENNINRNNDNIEEQLIDYLLKEIKIKSRLNITKGKCEPEAIKITEELLRINKNKEQDEIITKSIYDLITKLRELIANIGRKK